MEIVVKMIKEGGLKRVCFGEYEWVRIRDVGFRK